MFYCFINDIHTTINTQNLEINLKALIEPKIMDASVETEEYFRGMDIVLSIMRYTNQYKKNELWMMK